MKKPSPGPAVDAATPAMRRIGRFYLTRELGRGSIGTVYLAHDPVIDRSLAIKTFSAQLTPLQKRQAQQQFINEARAAGRLSHPNIITIFDASTEGEVTYIAMEYLQGRELSRMLSKGHRFSHDDVGNIILKVAEALAYAHTNGVVHRDIKPANIFMSDSYQPKIVDFGIARSPNRVADAPMNGDEAYTLFQNNLLGTPNYMSPEQAMGRTVDARTDIYSLGSIMYEMLSQRKPHQANSTDQILQSIAHKAPTAPHEIDPKIPMALSKIVMRAMSKRPDKRYQTAEEMALEIKNYLFHERRARHPLQKPAAEHPDNVAPMEIPRYFWFGCVLITVSWVAIYILCLR